MSTRPHLDAELARARTRLDKLSGRMAFLDRRQDELVAEVSLAKGRAAARPELVAIFEEMQREEHDLKIGRYSSMLSAFAQEVIEGKPEVGLKLGIERGLPSLDIFEKRRNGGESDILDDSGGALTNVICSGLRIIATACSGMRQFMALDEPDCWTEEKNAPAFYRVLHELTQRTGMQVFVITHQSLEELPADVNLVELTGTASDPDGLRVSRRPGARGWDSEEQEGLRYLALRNFQSFKDAVLPLSPGLNVIIGGNNIGKSRLLRALRAVFYGMASDQLLRDPASPAEVDIGFERGHKLEWSRNLKRNPVNLWRMTGPAAGPGASREVLKTPDDKECDGSAGARVPDWVGQMTGIRVVDNLDIQLAHQKKPLFLIDRGGPDRARVLSMDGDSGLLRDMIQITKDERTADAAVIRSGEKELARIRDDLKVLEDLPLFVAELAQTELAAAQAAEACRLQTEAENALAAAEDVRARLDQARLVIVALEDLPQEPVDITDLLAEIRDAEARGKEIRRVRQTLAANQKLVAELANLPAPPDLPLTEEADRMLAEGLDLQARLAAARSVVAATEGLPDTPPELPKIDTAQLLYETAVADRARLAQSTAQAAQAQADETAVALEISDMLVRMGSHCPLCGTPGISHEHVLKAEAA